MPNMNRKISKKLILLLSAALGTTALTRLEAPTTHERIYHEKQPIKLNYLLQLEPIDSIKRYMELREKEFKIAGKDEIFRYIIYAYDSVKVPEYITKKFVRAQIWAESWDTPNARGKRGEKGLMQLIPEAWRCVENKLDYKKNAFNPEKNVYVGIKYLSWLAKQAENYHSNWNKLSDEEKRKNIAAVYNAGIGRLISSNWDINKIPKITKRYIRNIENLMERKYKDY